MKTDHDSCCSFAKMRFEKGELPKCNFLGERSIGPSTPTAKICYWILFLDKIMAKYCGSKRVSVDSLCGSLTRPHWYDTYCFMFYLIQVLTYDRELSLRRSQEASMQRVKPKTLWTAACSIWRFGRRPSCKDYGAWHRGTKSRPRLRNCCPIILTTLDGRRLL